jgi:hypothetical protein
MSAWFARGIAVPRAAAVAGVLLAARALNSVGNYRAATSGTDGPDWSKLAEIDIVGDFTTLLRDGGLEMRNAVLRIHDAARLMAFDFGLFHWNVLVFNFVPAQNMGSRSDVSAVRAVDGTLASPGCGGRPSGAAQRIRTAVRRATTKLSCILRRRPLP